MNYLLDTHVFLWFLEGNSIPEDVEREIKNSDNNIYVSITSLWEIAIKLNLGKLNLAQGFDSLIHSIANFDFEILPIGIDHLNVLLNLPHIHRDPFDRMIIAQAIAENLPVITKDQMFSNYPINAIW